MTLTKDSSERESRPPSGQSNKTGSRRPSPARDVTPPLKVMETLASLRSNEASAQQKDAESTSRPKSKTPPGPQPTYQQQHYYPYPPPPPHMYSVPPYENNWGRMMPPPPPGDRGRDSRGSESPVPGNTTGYSASGMPGYSLHHHQGHHHHHPHDPYPPPPPHHYTHSPYPYGNPNGVHMPVYPVQTSYTYNPGVAAYGSHPPPYGGAGGNGIVGSNYGPNGESINMPPPSEQENNIHSIGPGAPPSSVPGNGFAAITATLTHTPIPESEIIYTEDAATKVTDRIRRRCYNCFTSDTSTWRRSNLAVGKVLCNKCGLFERTHSRPRPEQFPHKRTSLGGEGEGAQSPSSPSYPLTPVPSQSPSQPQDTPLRPPPSRKESIGPVKRNKKAKVGHDQPGSTDANTQNNAPSSSSGGHGPGPISALHVPSQGVTNGPPSSNSPSNSYAHSSLPAGLAHLTHPHPPQHQPYYGNNTSGSPSYPNHPQPHHSSHTMYTGGAFGVPLHYNGYPGGNNGYSLPPIGGPGPNHPSGYEYPQPHHSSHQQQQQQQHHSGSPPPQRQAGAPVTGLQGLLNGVDGRGRDSRESSAPAPYKKPSSDAPVQLDPSLSQGNNESKNERREIEREEADKDVNPSRRDMDSEKDFSSKSATSKSPTKSSAGTRSPRKSAKQSDNQLRQNGKDSTQVRRGASPESGSEYHSAMSDEDYRDNADIERNGSGDDYSEEEDDDDGSGAYRGNASASRGAKGIRGRPSRSVAKRQTRMSGGAAGAGMKRKRSLRGSSLGADE
ncbi:hypothetical protein GGU10DRAFT_339606 [Lentinula aff. detonsa]|uniref:GATA-type domain-containing protein n=1 Tax=Lentinula aff. detonsa TaxID=2804958 RepID=A0AA38NTF1_9AGAR|nr:hypothetical protein GGU10DRAFT_339606 [Lentinula aff. detonsa]